MVKCLKKSIDNQSLEDEVERIVNDEIIIDSGTLADGTESEPSLHFLNDPDSGLFRVSDNVMGLSTNGIQRIEIGTATTDVNNVFRINYITGTSQFAFQLPDLTYDMVQYVDTNEDFHIRHGEFDKQIYIEHASAGGVVVRPNSTAITNVEFCVGVGDGVSAYTDLFQVDENFIRSNLSHRFEDGLVGAPAITFNNSSTSGLYRIGADDIGMSTGGALEMSWNTTNITAYDPILGPNGTAGSPSYSFSNFTNNGMYSTASTLLGFSVGGNDKFSLNTSTDSAVFATHNILFPSSATDVVLTNQDDECIRFETASEQISFEAGGNNKMVIGTAETISLQDFRLNDGFHVVFDADSTTDAQAGTATLVAGKVTVSCSHIQADDIIMVNYGTQSAPTNPGSLSTDTVIANTSFIIESTNVSDTSEVNWFIVKNN